MAILGTPHQQPTQAQLAHAFQEVHSCQQIRKSVLKQEGVLGNLCRMLRDCRATGEPGDTVASLLAAALFPDEIGLQPLSPIATQHALVHEVLSEIIPLLQPGCSRQGQYNACRLLIYACKDNKLKSRDQAVADGAVPRLVQLIRDSGTDESMQVAALRALDRITSKTTASRPDFSSISQHASEELLLLLRNTSSSAVGEAAAGMLECICRGLGAGDSATVQHIVSELLAMIRPDEVASWTHAAEALADVCASSCDQDVKHCASAAVPTLLHLLDIPPVGIDYDDLGAYMTICLRTLAGICRHCPENQGAARAAGAWPSCWTLCAKT